MMNHIKRAWRGEEKLWIVFWIYGVLGGFLFQVAEALLVQLGWVASVAFAILGIVYGIWLMVATWRCAMNANWKFWGYLARFFILLFVLIFSVSLILGSIVGYKEVKNLKACDTELRTAARTAGVDEQVYIHQHANECLKSKDSGLHLVSLPAGSEPYVAECEADYTRQNPGKDPKGFFAWNMRQLEACVKHKMSVDQSGNYRIRLPDDVAHSEHVSSCLQRLTDHAKANKQDPQVYVRDNNQWIIDCVRTQKNKVAVQ